MDNNKDVKVIANYLPQYHCIPENDKWWGKGFTDWIAAKEAKPLYKGHRQPRVPENDNYYDLLDVNAIKWQAHLARENGIYGFGIYHYWFSSELKLLEKPAELLLKNKDIDIHYLFIWDNTSWVRTWTRLRFSVNWVKQNEIFDKEDNGILAELIYGNEIDWKKHFEYLLQFFQDDRYIKIDNKPIFIIFNPNNKAEILKKMIIYWNTLAKQNGFDGILVIGKRNIEHVKLSDYEVDYEPAQSVFSPLELVSKIYSKFNSFINAKLNKHSIYDYDKAWHRIIKKAFLEKNKKIFYSGFVDFDDTPRRGKNARIIQGSTPDKFGKYFLELLKISKESGKEFVFLTAWNEWGEGAYLEPDTENGTAYLRVVKKAVEQVNGKD